MKNNNNEIIGLLAGKIYALNLRRNNILKAAVAISFFLLFSIFSIVVGRINAEKLMFMRMSGTAATTFLEDATLEQAEQVAKLDYIQDVGMEYILGVICKEKYNIGIQVYVDQATFDSMLKPAYTQMNGKYPKNEDEVMLSRRILESMDIHTPKIGMEVKIDDGEGKEGKFILSGFYTEFMGEETYSYGFFSKRYYERLAKSERGETVLAIRQKDWYSGEKIENLLYKDVPTIDLAQQFIGGNSVSYTAVLELVGGFDIGLCGAVLIILCCSMLIYNVMSLSLHREVRQYGLLKTLGTTSWQIYRIAWKQIVKILFIGIVAGMAAGGVFVFGILPKVLEGRYLDGFGEASAMISFHPVLLAGAIILTIGCTVFSSFVPVWKVGRLAPVKALHYLGGMAQTGRKIKKSSKRNQIAVMAWRNIFRNRKSAFVTLGSLLLGFTVALGSMVLVRGMDYRNRFEKDNDFKLSAVSAPFLSEGYQDADVSFDVAFVEKIRNLEGIEDIKCSVGGYLRLDSADDVWQPLLIGSRMAEGMQNNEENRRHAEQVRRYYMAGFTVVDGEFIDALEQCSKLYHITLDIEGLRAGTSAVAFHFNELSRQLEDESVSHIGNLFSLKTFGGDGLGEIKFGGYLKRSQKGLPPCETETSTSGYPTLLISRECFERLGIEEKIFALNIDVQEKMEPQVRYQLQQMIQELEKAKKEQENVFGEGYFMYSKSEAIAQVESELLPIRILMYTVGALLACMGLFNYFNVTVSSLEARKTEFIVMESLGMTGKELRRMLVLEGVYYSSLIAVFLLTAGSGIMWLVYRIGKARISYMQFYYPVAGLVALLVLIYIGCICLPLWILKRSGLTLDKRLSS
jgi:ABC-type antimicrobial peptide transport system permease subunit